MNLGERIKNYYENQWKFKLPMRMPIIVRIDGKNFHTWTRKHQCVKPFDRELMKIFDESAVHLCYMIPDVQFAYLQSDEINLLIHNYKTIEQEAWYDNNLQKIVSIIASTYSSLFNFLYFSKDFYELAFFDCRAFCLPENEVVNYFIWRQKDWERNSIQMLARQFYSHKELNNKKRDEIHEMLFQKNVNWANLSTQLKNGRCVVKRDDKWIVDHEIPIFTQDREYVEKYLKIEDNDFNKLVNV